MVGRAGFLKSRKAEKLKAESRKPKAENRKPKAESRKPKAEKTKHRVRGNLCHVAYSSIIFQAKSFAFA